MASKGKRAEALARVAAGRRERFLLALTEKPDVLAACKRAGLPRTTAYAYRRQHPEFMKAWDDALEQGLDALEHAYIARALNGTRRPVFQGGKLVGHEPQFNDRATEFILSRRRPDVWGERVKVDLTVDIAARMLAARQRRLAQPVNALPDGSDES